MHTSRHLHELTIDELGLQDQEKLEPGGFYLDRKPQSKHLWGGGTQYSQQDVDSLWQKLSKLSDMPP